MKTVIETVKSTSLVLVFADFKEITKARLAVSVVFSSIAGYFLGAEQINAGSLLLLAFGGYCMVGASNAYNQIIEKDLDALMNRTKNRPIPAGRMTVNTALSIAVVLTVLGVIALYFLNPKTAMFGAISIFLYTSVYTPLKTITPLAVFVGAFPGAIPFMLGWVAATNDFGIEPGTSIHDSVLSGSSHIFGPWDGCWMRIIKREVSKCCPRVKKMQAPHYRLLCTPFG